MRWEELELLERIRTSGRRAALATVLHAPPGPVAAGARLVVTGEAVEGSLGHAALDRAVVADARRLLELGASRTYGYRLAPDGTVEGIRERRALLESGADVVRVFIEVVGPPPRLLVFGAGHDAIPLVRIAHMVGFAVTVVDPREAYLTRERFPEAEQLVRAHPDEVPEKVDLPPGAYAVVMTHNYLHDRALLRALLPRRLAYLGVLGPWERTGRLLAELAEEGVIPAGARPDHLYAPIGLDIGAEGPEQIAVAVVAEMLAVRAGRSGGSLRFRTGPLHPEWRAV